MQKKINRIVFSGLVLFICLVWCFYSLKQNGHLAMSCSTLRRPTISDAERGPKSFQTGIQTKKSKKAVPQPNFFLLKFEYADGNANLYQVGLKNEKPWIQYQPISQEQSSSGFYDGGKPKSGHIPQKLFLEILAFVPQVVDDQSCHLQERLKGSGQFTYLNRQAEKNSTEKRDSVILAPKSPCQQKLEGKLKEALAQARSF